MATVAGDQDRLTRSGNLHERKIVRIGQRNIQRKSDYRNCAMSEEFEYRVEIRLEKPKGGTRKNLMVFLENTLVDTRIYRSVEEEIEKSATGS